MLRTLILFCITILVLPSPTDARTWRVEKDGSGDFTIIQDALDAAAPGDSVLIGPGRFDTFRPGTSIADGYDFQMIVWVTKPDLTIIGAGPAETIIGPSTRVEEIGGRRAGGVFLDIDAPVTIQGLAVENVGFPMTCWSASTIRDCRLSNILNSTFALAFLGGSGAQVVDCFFDGPNGILTGQNVSNLVVDSCEFTDDTYEGRAISISNGAQNCAIRNCTIARGAGGIGFFLGSTGVVEDCVISETEASGIFLSGGHVVVRRCVIGPGARQPLRLSQGTMEVYDSEIGGGTTATIWGSANLTVRNSHILNIGSPSVIACCSNPARFDLAYNWWGSNDVQQIEQWIDDPYDRVTFLPILDEPVAVEPTSFGAFKSRY